MATVTIEGSRNLVYVDLNVWEASYDIGSNTSNVSYSVVIRKGSKSWNTSWASWGQKIYVSYSINGSSFTTYIPTYNYNGQVPPGSTIASGTINNISHNADGTKSIAFGISLTDNANGNNSGSYYTPGNASWKESSLSLTTIPRQANMTSAPDFNDEQNPTIGYSNPAGNAVSSLQACISLTGSAADIAYRDISKTGSSYTFDLTDVERNVLRNACTTSNSRNVTFFVRTIIGGNTFYSTITKTLSITNASPTFSTSNVSYKDNNSTTVGVTGNNQKLVQNLSSLLVTITSATAKKGASITKYEATINGTTKTITSAGNIDFGVINSGSNLNLTVKVTDSRGNTNSCSKTVTFLPWILPTGVITLRRKNNYEDETYLKVQALYSSVDSKNTISIKYQFKKTNETTYSSLTSLNNNTQVTISKAKANAWDFKIIITDKFGSTTYNTVLAKGQFILFVDTKKLSVGVNCFPKNNESLELNGEKLGALDFNKIYPVGSIYLTVTNDNPGNLFGGTWEKMSGGYLYGCVNSIGNGNGTGTVTNNHTLTLSEIPSHNHSLTINSGGSHSHAQRTIGNDGNHNPWVGAQSGGSSGVYTKQQTAWYNSGKANVYTFDSGGHGHSGSIGSSGGSGGHSHNIPYIGVWVWKRTK